MPEIKIKDFIEINFTAKTKEGEVFDSNRKEELEKVHAGHDHKIEAKPFIMCVGEGMFLKGIEDFIIGKKEGNYKIELSSEKAFGKRDHKLVCTLSLGFFKKNETNPVPGQFMNFDGKIGKILSVNGGRVIVDFNNPLAGKSVVYDLDVKRILTDLNEKIKAMIDFLFREDFPFEVKEKDLILEVKKGLKEYAGLLKDKFKAIFDLNLVVKEREDVKGDGK